MSYASSRGRASAVLGLQGLAAAAVGLLLLVRPTLGASLFWVVIGGYLLAHGCASVYQGLRSGQPRGRWQWIGGLLSAAGGVIAITNPMAGFYLTATILSLVVGIAALISGLMSLTRVRRLDASGTLRFSWGTVLVGALKIGFGLLIMARPVFATAAMLRVLGAWALIGGLILLAIAYRTRDAAA